MDTKVRVLGLRELQGAFRQVDKDLNRQLKFAMKDIATKVVGIAQQRMPFSTGTAAKSIKPRATQRGAGIAFPAGGPESRHDRTGYYPWLDFGGTTGRGHVARGHTGYGGSIWRYAPEGGRYIYPAIGQSKSFIEREVLDAIMDVARRSQFETRG